MKRIMALFAAMLMLLSVFSVAFAQEAEPVVEDPAVDTPATETPVTEEPVAETPVTEAETPVEETVDAVETGVVTTEEVDEAGITPDQPVLWGIERAIERISLAMTFNKSAKAQKGLAYARERLMEVKTMIAEKKFDKAEKAREQHGKALGHVKKAVEEMDGDNAPEETLQEQAEFEGELEEQKNELEQTREKARTRLKLTAEQQAKIAALVNEFNGDVSDARVKVELKKNKVKIAIQAKTGKSSEEVDKLDNYMKEKVRQDIRAVKRESNQEIKAIRDEAKGEIQQIKTGAREANTGSEDGEGQEQEDNEGDESVDVGGAVSIESDDDEED